MNRILYPIFACLMAMQSMQAQTLTEAQAAGLARLPLKCITVEFPNKTSHTAESATDAVLLPNQLHPVFYGCFDWHSSVHGHWLLVRVLKTFPNIALADSIRKTLNNSFTAEKMEAEARYFDTYSASSVWERTYGWAWLLKLDEELLSWNTPEAQRWHQAMQPLTQKIVGIWKNYLPKQTYPNRTGVHPNTAFGLVFALQWARAVKDSSFENAIVKKARDFYADNYLAPAYLEPDGSDFLSPSLEVADLMKLVMSPKEFLTWFGKYYDERSLARITSLPEVSDRSDLQIVHLDGLALSRAWCFKGLAKVLPVDHPWKKRFTDAAKRMLDATLPQIASGHYSGEHWLASFALYALSI